MTARKRKTRRRVGPAADSRRAETMRQRLAVRLPYMLDAAIAAYHRIAAQTEGTDAKTFAAAQTGAKAALGHIEQLIALAEAVCPSEAPEENTGGTGPDDLERLVATARAALAESEAGGQSAPSDAAVEPAERGAES